MSALPSTATSVDDDRAARVVLEVEDLHIEYVTELGDLQAVRGISFVVHERESYGIVGESGSGKSTLAMGAVRYLASNGRITSGSVRLNGVELLDLSKKELRALWGGRSPSFTRALSARSIPPSRWESSWRRWHAGTWGWASRRLTREWPRCSPRSPCPMPRPS